jgi:hypothetical protein
MARANSLPGKVSENANISSAVLPAWRTAKGHVCDPMPFLVSNSPFTDRQVIALAVWNETSTPDEVEAVRASLTNKAVPIIANATGVQNSGSYSNEADVREPNFQVTFFGENYARLSEIKAKYDPHDLFIVGAGVGSERWDADGLCTVQAVTST